MATVKVLLKTHRKKDDGTFPICIRISHEGKSRYKYMGFAVKIDQFKDAQGDWVKKHPDALFINATIEDVRSKIMEKITRLRIDGRPFDFDYIISDVPAQGHTVSDIFDVFANRFAEAKSMTLYYRMISMKRELQELFNGERLINDIKHEDVRAIEAYYRHKRGNKSNTVAWKIKNLRGIFREAKRLWAEALNRPFEGYRVKGEPVDKTKLTLVEIEAIETLSLIGVMDLYRDAFLFSFYTQGMRFGSVILIKKNQCAGDVIKYQMTKGLHFRELKVHPKLKRIIDKYSNSEGPYALPILKREPKDKVQLHMDKNEANTVANTCLKRIAILAGINSRITFHVAKHSFAQMLKKAGVDPWIVKDSLGHTNFSTTEAYLASLDDDHINQAVTGLY